jgi:ATP diphosphatase
VDNNGAKKTVTDLIAVMAALRTPGTGCPWDLQQTFATIAPYTIEEAYEVADAIAKGDLAHLKDELGDLLFQVVYHARMAEEQNAFAFADVVDAITAKMIRRHPHVFGSPEQRAAGAAPGFWERAKAAEKNEKAAQRAREAGPDVAHREDPSPSPRVRGEGHGGAVPPARGEGQPRTAAPTSLLADVPLALPALTRAVKLQNKAARVGFDWPSLAPVLAKLKEELAELEAEIGAQGVRPAGSDTGSNQVAEEFGDLLFVLANVARHLKLDPEAALRSANEKFIRRFRYIEARLAEDGRTPAQSDLAEMDALWDEAKTRDH